MPARLAPRPACDKPLFGPFCSFRPETFFFPPSVLERMRGSEWAPLYLLVVLAIAAILLVTFVKPMFRTAAVAAEQNADAAKAAAKSFLPLLLWPASLLKRKKAAIELLGIFQLLRPTPPPGGV